jgi:hypothetical protein
VAGCERGYLCTACSREVEELPESELYLRYVMGEVPWDQLHRFPERHIRCNPVLAQFIVHAGFAPVVAEGAFAKASLDPDYVRDEELRVTAGYERLCEIAALNLPISEYPLPHVLARRAGRVFDSEG